MINNIKLDLLFIFVVLLCAMQSSYAVDGNEIETSVAFQRSATDFNRAVATLIVSGVAECSRVRLVVKEGREDPIVLGSIRNPSGKDRIRVVFNPLSTVVNGARGASFYLQANCLPVDESAYVASEENGGTSTSCSRGAVTSAASKMRRLFSLGRFSLRLSN